MKRPVLAFLALSLFSPAALGAPSPSSRPQSAYAPQLLDVEKVFDANEIRCPVSNIGILGFDLDREQPGFEWPRGTGKHPIFTTGLWLVALPFGRLRVAVADYETEFWPGPSNGIGNPLDPSGANPNFHVYKIGPQDLVDPSEDYKNWPTGYGAPSDENGNPRLVGDQTLFCDFGDGNDFQHDAPNGGTQPLPVEVRLTLYGYNRPGALQRVMIAEYEFLNMGPSPWAQFYAGAWVDPDLGDPEDDLAGSDSAAALAYAYDGAAPVPGIEPEPAVGVALLATAASTGPVPGALAMAGYGVAQDPKTPDATLALLRGTRASGQPWLCQDGVTRFPYGGDPVTGAGCLDTVRSDKRILLSVGPFNIPQGHYARMVVAYLIGSSPGSQSPADNVDALRQSLAELRASWDEGFTTLPPPATKLALSAPSPNPFRDATECSLALPPGAIARALEVLDVRGRVWWREAPLPTAIEGYSRVSWRGQTLSGVAPPAGLYFLRVLTDQGAVSQPVVRLR